MVLSDGRWKINNNEMSCCLETPKKKIQKPKKQEKPKVKISKEKK